jgi:hypothetical protein
MAGSKDPKKVALGEKKKNGDGRSKSGSTAGGGVGGAGSSAWRLQLISGRHERTSSRLDPQPRNLPNSIHLICDLILVQILLVQNSIVSIESCMKKEQ